MRAGLLFASLMLGCGHTPGRSPDAGSPDLGTEDHADLANLAGGGDLATASPPDLDLARPLPALPLSTSGRFIIDRNGKRVKLVSVNWYGAEEGDSVVSGLDRQPLDAIARRIADAGFNSVRLLWSNYMFETNPVIANARLAANPQLSGLSALDVFDAVVAALGHYGLMVILDNHMSDPKWCCSNSDGNELWYNAQYPESAWLADWKAMVKRYVNQPAVVAADLRNELRGPVTWGSGNAGTDWRLAAQKGGNAVLTENPTLLIMVEGLNYSLDFSAVYSTNEDVHKFFTVDNKLVWSPHDYAFDHTGIVSYDGQEPALKTQLGNKWGFLLVQGKPYTAPVWIGEFGTCNNNGSCVDSTTTTDNGFWFSGIRRYLRDADIDWCYWPWNGTAANGGDGSHTVDAVEGYGIMNVKWDGPALPALLSSLQAIQPATQGP